MKTNIEVTLTKEEVQEAIVNYLTSHGWNARGITFNYRNTTEGFGDNEYNAVSFDGAVVQVERIKGRNNE